MKIPASQVLSILLASVKAQKKVPNRTPTERMAQLKRHIQRLVPDFFSACRKSAVFEEKLLSLADRAQAAYDRQARPCSFFDPNLEHGGPRPDCKYLKAFL